MLSPTFRKHTFLIVLTNLASFSLNARDFDFSVKPFDTSTLNSIPWGRGRPASSKAVPQNLLNCLSEITFTHRLAPYTQLVATGKLIVNNDLVDDLQEILEELFQDNSFSMSLAAPIHHFKWDDEISMRSNNTSGFNFRYINGTTKLSNHSKGRAIDINPRVNPYINGSKTKMYPANASASLIEPGSLLPGTPAHKLINKFTSRGWIWGGHWKSAKDYQHFEKKISYPGNKYCQRPW